MVEINLFEIKKFPPSTLYSFLAIPPSLEEKKSFAYKNDGILYDENVISYKKPKEEYPNLTQILSKELPINIKEQLIRLFLIKENNLINRINSFFKPIFFQDKDYYLRKYVDGSVTFIKNRYFFYLDIYHQIASKADILTLLKRGIDVVNMKVTDKDKATKGILTKVIYPEENEYESKKAQIEYYLNIKAPIEPIAIVNYKDKEYPYLVSRLQRRFDISDIENPNFKIPNFERKKLLQEAIKHKANELLKNAPLKTDFISFQKPNLISKSQIKHPKHSIKKENNLLKITPIRYPKNINSKIDIIFLIDKNLQSKRKQSEYIKILIKSLNFNNFRYKNSYFINFTPSTILQTLLNYKNDSIPPLVILLSSTEKGDYYEDTKRKLFQNNFITQNIIYPHLLKNREFELKNLLYQILAKYGMYPFIVELNSDYDYIIGIDVGNNRYGKRNIAGGISIINKAGFLEKLIPIEVLTGGENIDLGLYIEKISSLIDLSHKKILLLRDGRISKKEIESVKTEIKSLNLDLTLINITKNHNFRFFDTNGHKGVILKKDLALLLSHKDNSARAIKISQKINLTPNKIQYLNITNKDLELLYKLTFINYSNPFKENLRLPAPIHYSDKFVKALGKEWRIEKKLLLEGFLYFL